MHKIHAKEFTEDDFSHEFLDSPIVKDTFQSVLNSLNNCRKAYLECKDVEEKKKIWYAMIQLLPESYNQLRTWDISMATLLSMLSQRENHKLTNDWGVFCDTCLENVPYCKEFYEAIKNK